MILSHVYVHTLFDARRDIKSGNEKLYLLLSAFSFYFVISFVFSHEVVLTDTLDKQLIART